MVGVADSKLGPATQRRRAKDAIEKSDKIDDTPALGRLLALLSFVSCECNDPGTFKVHK